MHGFELHGLFNLGLPIWIIIRGLTIIMKIKNGADSINSQLIEEI